MLLVEVHQIQEALMSLLKLASQLDIPMTSLKILEPNLETVFLRLTGKSLRDYVLKVGSLAFVLSNL